MRTRRHPLSHAMYDVRDDGNVEVAAKTGETGVFTPDGEWIEGELRHARPQLPPGRAVLPRFCSLETAGSSS